MIPREESEKKTDPAIFKKSCYFLISFKRVIIFSNHKGGWYALGIQGN
jgi:hypothetical protein